jgi:hypothetical protein
MILRLIAGALVAFGILKLFKPLPTDEEINERLHAKAGEHLTKTSERLDPFNSIVDFMKLLGLDPTFASRKELWGELGLAGEFTGTAEQNIQLNQELRVQLKRGDFADRL